MIKVNLCALEGCHKPVLGYGWCSMHYSRWRKHGSTDDPRPDSKSRFFARLDKDGPSHPVYGKCWIWTGPTDRDGYGKHCDKKLTRLAHRVSWLLHSGGEIPEGVRVLHKCDNPSCVNPEHLFLGSDEDNVRDCILKNRRADVRGRRNPQAKLNDALVREARSRYHAGVKLSILARRCGVTYSVMEKAVKRMTWKHVI